MIKEIITKEQYNAIFQTLLDESKTHDEAKEFMNNKYEVL